jgi:hypothetical protein
MTQREKPGSSLGGTNSVASDRRSNPISAQTAVHGTSAVDHEAGISMAASREAIEAWRAANPWPWLEALHAYTLANSDQDVREYQMQWEPESH